MKEKIIKKLTSRTTKTILVLGLLTALMIPIAGMSFVDAQTSNDSTIGKNFIKNEISSESIPLDRERVKEINIDINNKDLSMAQKASLQEELDTIGQDLRDWHEKNNDPIKEKLAREKQELLNSIILGETSNTDEEQKLLDSIPFTTIRYDYVDNALEITIEPEKHNPENISKYIQNIRKLIGYEVDLTLSPAPHPMQNGCSSRSSFCDEPEGGMRFGVDGYGVGQYCSIGFRATYNNELGFVTAGHCLADLSGEDVVQPNGGTTIGWVEFEEYDDSGGNSYDAGFVAMDDEVAEMSDNIFGTSNPNTTKNASFGMQVTMSGGTSEVKTGYVTAENVTADYGASYVTQLVAASYDADGGDSGSPVIMFESGVAKLVGIHSGTENPESGNDAFFTRQEKVTSEISGLAWDF